MSSILSTFFGQVFTRKLFAFAGGSLLVYDYLLTLSLEVTHIWNEPWTLVKSLFLINRYGNLIGQTFIVLEEIGYLSHGSRNFCLAFQVYCPLFTVFSGESVRIFVVMRTCAILGCRRRVALVVNTLYILYGVATFVVTASLLVQYIDVIQFELLDEVGLCIVPVYSKAWTFWFIPLFLDGCMIAMAFYSLFQSTRGPDGTPPSPLMSLLVRDGFLFYIATLFNVLFGIVCWTVYSQDPRNFLQTLIAYPFLTIIGQRLVLNLRGCRAQPNSTFGLSRPIAALFEEQSSGGSDLGFEMDQFGKIGRRGDSDWRSSIGSRSRPGCNQGWSKY